MIMIKSYTRQVLNKLQASNFKMSIYCLDENVRYNIIYELALRMVAKNASCKLFIVVEEYSFRAKIRERFIKDNNTDIFEKNVVLLSQGYVNPYYNYSYNMMIYVGKYIDINLLDRLIAQNKYCLMLLTENVMDNKFISGVRKFCPDAGFAIQDLKYDISQPVEGMMRSININEDDRDLYEQYTKYINEVIAIFGSIEMINMARSGNSKTNTSAAEIREQIAKQNGWSETLDTRQDYQKEIDRIFNPSALYEKACNFFSIADKRRKLVSNNQDKLDKILEIVRDNEDKKIIIVSKNDEFANEVSVFLRKNGYECGDYHDNIPDRILIGADGVPKCIKSGKNAGKIRTIKSQAISTLDLREFNNDTIRILSIKHSSNMSLSAHCDVLIFTSTLCPDIIEFKNRFRGVKVNSTPNIVYYVYCENTIEENSVKNFQSIPFLTLKCEKEKNVIFDEKSNQIIL